MFRLNSGQHLEEQINSMMLTIKHQLFPVRNHASRASVTALFSWLPQFQGYEPNRGGWEWSNADVMNYINWETNPSSSSGNHCGTLSRASGKTRAVLSENQWFGFFCLFLFLFLFFCFPFSISLSLFYVSPSFVSPFSWSETLVKVIQ